MQEIQRLHLVLVHWLYCVCYKWTVGSQVWNTQFLYPLCPFCHMFLEGIYCTMVKKYTPTDMSQLYKTSFPGCICRHSVSGTVVYNPTQKQHNMVVASAIGSWIVSAVLMQHTHNCVVRWQDQWLAARGRWHCSPSLCWCAGATASHVPISTAASSQPWSSSRFWSPLSKSGHREGTLYFFGGQGTGTGLPAMIQTQHLPRVYCMKNSDTVGQKNQLRCCLRFRELE